MEWTHQQWRFLFSLGNLESSMVMRQVPSSRCGHMDSVVEVVVDARSMHPTQRHCGHEDEAGFGSNLEELCQSVIFTSISISARLSQLLAGESRPRDL